MASILVISSYVARGHVGLQGAGPVLDLLGHQVIALPTIVLSNHLGHPAAAGQPLTTKHLDGMVAALEKNGWLKDVEAVLVGYLPTADHVSFARKTITRLSRLRASPPFVLVDPIFGDDPDGLYCGQDVAAAIRDALLPLASLTTPNRFELSWLSGRPVSSPSDAISAARAIMAPAVVATSLTTPDSGNLATLLVAGGNALIAETRKLDAVPHGTGDVLSALLIGHHLNFVSIKQALAKSLGCLTELIAASQNHDELRLSADHPIWLDAEPAALRPASRAE